jgi:hypothetical protein
LAGATTAADRSSRPLYRGGFYWAKLLRFLYATVQISDALGDQQLRQGVITEAEFKTQLSTERANYLAVLKRLQ